LAIDSIGPEVIYLKPQIISAPDEIRKVFPLSEHFIVASLISYPLLAKGRIMGLLYLIRDETIPPYSSGELDSLSILAGRAAAGLENSRLYQQLENAYLSTINALANAVEARDVYTKGHTERVCYLAETLARRLGWGQEQLSHVRMGSILHDIGKIGVPDSILNKPKPLTPAEFEVMKQHPQMGVKILEGIGFLEPALPYVLYHHERYDGKGYPTGLKGEDVPMEGRLMAVVDTFDAITSDRPYRKNLGYQKAIQELKDFSGTQFDPQVAQAMIEAWEAGQIDQQRLEIKISPPARSLPAEIFSQIQT
jgi:putative nucleotidyltransferase with HDIG domain